MNKYFYPKKSSENPFSSMDGDTALILMLILIVLREGGDTLIVLALIYILT